MSSPISGFTAIPNPQMLAFMPIQSYLMMYFAGAGWQIGKRKVSAIPNDKFNPMSAKDLLQDFTADLKESIPVLEKSLQDITPLIRILIEQYGDFIKEAINAMPQALQNIIGGGGEFENVPTTGGSGGGLPPQMASFLHYFKTLSDATKVPQSSRVLGPEEQTHAQRVAIQKIETARVKRLQDLLKAQTNAQIRADARSGTPISTFGKTKKRAGQSQKIGKKDLIRKIKQWGDNYRIMLGHYNKPGGSRNTKASQLAQAKIYLSKLKRDKQKLTDLLARYRF